jgi:quercetin dioxygenase-like cupin family protein
VSNEQTADAEEIVIGQIEIHYLVDGSARGHSGMFHVTLPPRSNVPPDHSHDASDEVVYVLKGRMRYVTAGVVHDLRQGESAFCPRGRVHGFSNPYGETASILTVLTPDIGAQYFRELAQVVNAGGPVNQARLLQVMRRHGLTVALPEEALAA